MTTVRLRTPRGDEIVAAVEESPMTLGREGGGADIEVPGDRHISRRHARLWLEGESIWYEDLGSANGSWLNGSRLESPLRLETETTIVLGESEMSLGPEVAPRIAGPDPKMTLRLEVSPSREPNEVLLGRYISALYEVVSGLLKVTSRQLVGKTLKTIAQVVPAAQRVSLVGLPTEDGRFASLAGDGDQGSEFSGGPISRSMAVHAITSGKALLLCEDTPAPVPAADLSAKMHGIRSAVYVPLLSPQGDPFGVLCVDTPEPGLPFEEPDFEFIRAVGGLLANAMTAETLREQAREKEVQAKELVARHETMTAFLKIASHDLKNPLTAIKLSACILDHLPPGGKGSVYTGVILDSVDRADRLITTYLEVARIGEALQVDSEEIDLKQMFEEEVAFLGKAHSGQPPFAVDLDGLDEPKVWADRHKLRQILTNLLSNAIKYSPSGDCSIQLESRRLGEDVVISVKDQGVGISEEDQTRLFQQFQRVGDRTLSAGTGLGLWLTQALIEAHGGRVWVHSVAGEGSTFSFSLPSRKAPNIVREDR